MIKVIIPEITIDKALIAPSISPISKAFEVPTAWLDIPIPIPFATGCFILKYLHTIGARTFPAIPVTKIAKIVIAGTPPKSLLSSIPIGVVIDLGINDKRRSLSIPKSFPRRTVEIIAVAAPTREPIMIGTKFFFNLSSCL